MEGIWHGWGYVAAVILFFIIMSESYMIQQKEGGANGFAWLIINVWIFIISFLLAIVTLFVDNFQTALSYFGYAVGYLFIEIVVSIGLFVFFASIQKK